MTLIDERAAGQVDAETHDWEASALCAQTDPEMFYPERGQPTAPAKHVCLSCSVRVPCLDAALANGERFGVWGGLSPAERKKLRRARAEG